MPMSDLFDNVTLTVSNTANFMYTCTTSVQSTQTDLNSYQAQFGSIDFYLLSFLMNMSGNVVNIITIFNLIKASNDNCDLTTIYYNSGRLFYKLSYVKPIEVVVRSAML